MPLDSTAPRHIDETSVSKDLTDVKTVIFGPVATKWFQFLQHRIQLSTPGRTLVARVATDQLVCAPTMIGVFLSTMSVLEGADPRDKLQRTYWDALRTNWMVWPALQSVNLYLVPLQYRVLVVNVINIGRSFVLSRMFRLRLC